MQCQSRGAGCRCTGVQWSRSAQVLMRTRAHLTFRFYFHPRTAFSRLQNGACLRQTCPLRFKNAIWRVPRRVPSQESIFRVPSQRPNLGAAAALAGRAAKNFQFSPSRDPASPRQVPDKHPTSPRQAVRPSGGSICYISCRPVSVGCNRAGENFWIFDFGFFGIQGATYLYGQSR